LATVSISNSKKLLLDMVFSAVNHASPGGAKMLIPLDFLVLSLGPPMARV